MIDFAQARTKDQILADLKDKKSAEIETACLLAIGAGFTFEGNQFGADLVSRTNLIGTVGSIQAGIPLPDGFTWRTLDEQNVPMTADALVALGAALLVHCNTQYAKSWALKAQVDATTTADEVEAISW
jgi:hypothetical protein